MSAPAFYGEHICEVCFQPASAHSRMALVTWPVPCCPGCPCGFTSDDPDGDELNGRAAGGGTPAPSERGLALLDTLLVVLVVALFIATWLLLGNAGHPVGGLR